MDNFKQSRVQQRLKAVDLDLEYEVQGSRSEIPAGISYIKQWERIDNISSAEESPGRGGGGGSGGGLQARPA